MYSYVFTSILHLYCENFAANFNQSAQRQMMTTGSLDLL